MPLTTTVAQYLFADEERYTADGTLTLDELFFILKNERRRLVIEYFEAQPDPINRSDLAGEIAKRVHGDGYRNDQRKCIYIGLYQDGLPKLEDAGIVHLDGTTVAPGPNHAQAVEALAAIREVVG